MASGPEISGFLNINKPSGPTSHDIVYGVRRAMGKGIKVGHAGTLDPFARGVLIVCVGGACRLADLVMGQTKKYIATVFLGASSSTDDPMGEIVASPSPSPPAAGRIAETLLKFTGTIWQTPPAHCAVFVDGVRAYKIARSGEEPNLKPRPVVIEKIDILQYDFPRLRIEITCGSGTYIRALARDIGQALGVGGYCLELTRTASGAFTLADAIAPENLDMARDLFSPLVALEHMAKVQLNDAQLKDVLMGRTIKLDQSPPPGEAAVLEPSGTLIALGEIRPHRNVGEALLQPTKVLRDTNKKVKA